MYFYKVFDKAFWLLWTCSFSNNKTKEVIKELMEPVRQIAITGDTPEPIEIFYRIKQTL